MANLADIPKSELVTSLQRAKSTMQRYRAEAEQVAVQGGSALAGVGGAVASGVLVAYRPNLVEGTDSPTDGIAGALLTLSSFFLKDGAARQVAMAGGIGMYAPAISRITARMVEERRGQ